MKAKLKRIDCLDGEPNSYIPDEDNYIAINFTLTIGKEDSVCGDNFDVFVCSPEWLTKNQWEPELIRHMLLVRNYNFDEIEQIINDRIAKCEGENWQELAVKLSRYFSWEFEDYQPYQE